MRGVLLNGFGVPFSEAKLKLLRLRDPAGPGPVLWDEYSKPTGEEQRPGVVELDHWVESAELRPDGRFELTGFRFLAGEHYALRVRPSTGPDFLHASEPGDLDAELRGPAGSGVALEVLADWDRLPYGSLMLLIHSSADSTSGHELTADSPGVRLALKPDPALRIEVFANSLQVHEIEEVTIREGQLSDLGLLDLTGRVETFEIEVRSVAGEFLHKASIWHGLPSGPYLYLGGAMDERDRHLCVPPTGAGEWFIEAPGCRLAQLDELVADQVVVLEPAIPVELVLGSREADAVLPHCVLVFSGSLPGRPGAPCGVQFDDDGLCDLQLARAGEWALEWYSPGTSPRRDAPSATQVLVVPAEGARFEVQAPAE